MQRGEYGQKNVLPHPPDYEDPLVKMQNQMESIMLKADRKITMGASSSNLPTTRRRILEDKTGEKER